MIRYVALGALLLALSIPAAAEANVRVLTSDGDTLVSFSSASCKKASKKGALLKFIATAKKSGYRLSVNIFQLSDDIDLGYGGDGPADFTVSGPGGSWTNLNRPPDAPPGGGAIRFNAKRTKLALGFSPAFNGSFSSSVGVGGALTCKYPPKKKKKKR
jgi:hypothetical protein